MSSLLRTNLSLRKQAVAAIKLLSVCSFSSYLSINQHGNDEGTARTGLQ
jgi:hypothetical protein